MKDTQLPSITTKFSMSRKKRISGFALLFSAFCFCSYVNGASARVSTRQALTLYGNAALSGLCTHLSTTRLWVCELSDSPDIHLTFNADTPLHITVRTQLDITVRTPSCEGNSVFDGEWPGKLEIAPGQPNTVCNVKIYDKKDGGGYLDRLNARPETIWDCEDSFEHASRINRLDARTANFYIQQCKLNPEPPQKKPQDEDQTGIGSFFDCAVFGKKNRKGGAIPGAFSSLLLCYPQNPFNSLLD
ncbi:hypothetical protein ELI03_08775 [Rhizobium leguminosarum]|uniref:Uncharacterized protein n=1 Tax=Rhizobium leguminosarum TaxID=384 RepID=A0A4Q8Y6V6_RHILE|nr:hypothetical protein [Rhizobium leguminosarum]TAX71824.1 hypothetical protein ELI03_08775 [Rhizobium leguminosarum]